jgi:hypothetical protein
VIIVIIPRSQRAEPPERPLTRSPDAAATARSDAAYKVTNARWFAFSILVEGENYARGAQVFMWNDIRSTPSNTLYEAQ